MTKSEYQELVEFLAGKFTRIDERFERIDQRFDRVDQRFDRVETRLTRVEVFEEENRGLIQTVAGGVGPLIASSKPCGLTWTCGSKTSAS